MIFVWIWHPQGSQGLYIHSDYGTYTTRAVCLDMYRVSHESRLQTGLQSEALDSIIKYRVSQKKLGLVFHRL